MKRVSFIIILTLIVFLVACGNQGNINNGSSPVENGHPTTSQATLTAKIVSIDDTNVLLANMADDANAADIYWLNVDGKALIGAKGDPTSVHDLHSGMIVEIHFDGIVMESFPQGLGKVDAIYVKEDQDDLVNFYLGVIDDLYNTDTGLNSNISTLAFDLTEVTNLSATEKTALIYLAGSAYNLESISGTFDELSELGYIDKEKLYFEKGLLFKLSDTKMSGNRFEFNASKWRSGLGAYFFHECIAKKKEGKWTYTVGAHMIS